MQEVLKIAKEAEKAIVEKGMHTRCCKVSTRSIMKMN